jgi:hypothetical protein
MGSLRWVMCCGVRERGTPADRGSRPGARAAVQSFGLGSPVLYVLDTLLRPSTSKSTRAFVVVSSDFFSSSASKSFFRFFGLDGWKPFFPRKESDSPEPGRSFGGAFLDTIATRRDS